MIIPAASSSTLLHAKSPPVEAPRTLTDPLANQAADKKELREAFDQFIGTQFYGQMLAAMRKTLHKPAYFHGGRGEEVFQKHLDQTLAEEMTKATAGQFSGLLFAQFELSQLARR
jgi:Rod binding domain-containing protein